MNYTYYNPVKIEFGQGVAKNLKNCLENYENILVVTDKIISSLPYFEEVIEKISGKNISIYNNTSANPSVENIVEAKKELTGTNYDVVIGIGGGSSLDLAKALVALRDVRVETREEAKEEILSKSYLDIMKTKKALFVAIPTTAGTGSEVTSWGTIWNKIDKIKYSLADELLYADYTYIDSIFMSTMPKSLTIITALDALCHATEAYWSKNTSEVVRNLALRGIELLVNGINKVNKDPKESNISMEVRDELAQGSTYAGLAFSNTKTTACHSISYPMTLIHGVEHGVAASITLGKVLELNLPQIIGKERLLKALDAKEPRCVEEFVRTSLEGVNYSASLKAYGIEKKDLDAIVEGAYTKGRMDNNPVYPTRKEVYDILKSIY